MQLRDSERCSLTDPLLFDHRIDFLKLARKVVIVPSEASTRTCEFETLKEPLRRLDELEAKMDKLTDMIQALLEKQQS